MAATKCPDDEELSAFVERRLDEPRRQAIEEHCDRCSRCTLVVSFVVEAFAERDADSPSAPGLDLPPLPKRGTPLGRYVLLEFLGAGAMGSVYTAFDPKLDRRVAVKVLTPHREDHNQDPVGLRQRFLTEGRAMASISHPNVIAVHDVGTEGPYAFFAMEYVEGQTLGEWLASADRTTRRIIDVFAAAGRGLAAAHAGDLVHRDFKPSNVLVGRDGRVLVIDFGLARFGDAAGPQGMADVATMDETGAAVTRTGAILGTPAYMAPEQLDGQPCDARADQFAFCVSLYEALYGERPFETPPLAARAKAIRSGALRLGPGRRRLPRRIQRIVARGLSPSPADRFETVMQLVDALTAQPLLRWWPVAAGLVAAVGLGMGVRELVSAPGPRCDRQRGTRALAEIWSPQRQAAWTEAHGATRASQWLATQFDAYAAHWAEVDHDLCVATIERRERSTTMHDLQRRCLDRARTQFGALLNASLSLDAPLTERAPEFASRLLPLDACTDEVGLAGGPPPPSAGQRDAVQTQTEALAEVHALLASGETEAALERARDVEAAAETIGYPPLLYEAMLTRANSAIGLRGDAKDAIETQRSVLRRVLSTRNERLALQVASDLACNVMHVGPEAGAAYGEMALGLSARPGFGTRQRARALRCMGRALAASAQYETSESHVRQAIELLGDEPSFELASTLFALGQVLGDLRRLDESAAHLRRAASMFADLLGAEHFNALLASSQLSAILVAKGDYAGAEVRLRGVIESWTTIAGPRSLNVAQTRGNLGNLYFRQDRDEEAEAEWSLAREIMIEQLGPNHPDTLTTEGALAMLLVRQGHTVEAREAYARLLVRMDRELAPSHTVVMQARFMLGHLEVEARRYAQALAAVDPGLESCAAVQGPTELCGRLQRVAARAQLELGRPDLARHLVTRIRQDHASVLPDEETRLLVALEGELERATSARSAPPPGR